MAKKFTPATRPSFIVGLKDPNKVHQAIADGKIPLNCAPVDLKAMARWAREAFKDGLTPQSVGWAEENGIEVREK